MTDQEVQFAYILLVGLLLVWLWARDIGRVPPALPERR